MKIDFLTLFPEMFSPLYSSIIGKAINNNIVEINTVNIRDYSINKHKKVDDYVFGGGEGMLLTPQPLFDCIDSVSDDNSYVVYVTPSGEPFTQKIAKELKEKEHLIFVCGHYEGIDQRVIDAKVDRELSIGDFVLTNGELPAMVIADSVIRLLPNVLNNSDSYKNDSFENSLLEHPQYTRPANFRGFEVPSVLLSGNHQEVEKWKYKMQLQKTRKVRPDLLKGKTFLEEFDEESKAKFFSNVDALKLTQSSETRIKKNLHLVDNDILKFCKDIILNKKTKMYKSGKNIHCVYKNIDITINFSSFIIITAHFVKN